MFPIFTKPAGFARNAIGSGGFTYSPTIAALLGRTGMTTIVNASADDASIGLGDIGFDFPIYGSLYRTNIFAGSNSYLTFGFGSSSYSGLTRSNPGRGLMINAADHDWNFVGIQASAGKFRVRFEGQGYRNNASSAVFIWEATLFSNGAIQLALNTIAMASGLNSLTKGDNVTYTDYTPNSFSAPNSVVFLPNDSAGNSHTVQVGSYG